MKDYKPSQKSSYIIYLDANNLYGWAMNQFLPISDFKFIEKLPKDIMDIPDDSETGYFLDVDLEYPAELHETHNDYPLAPETKKVSDDELSSYAKQFVKPNTAFTNKLMPNLCDKKNYIVHYRNLKYYLKQGLKLKKINRVIEFTQQQWLKPYIDFNSAKRAKARNGFEFRVLKKTSLN